MKSAGGSGRAVKCSGLYFCFIMAFFAALFFSTARISGDTAVTAQEAAKSSLRISVSPQKEKNAYISWEKVDGVSFYEVQRSVKKDGGFLAVASADAGCRQYTDTQTGRGNYYYYRVKAVLKEGGKVISNTAAFACPLKKVSGVKLSCGSASSINVTWNKNKETGYYKIYCGTDKARLKQAGVTKNSRFQVKKLTSGQLYYVRVQACAAKKASKLDSGMSKAAKIRTKELKRTTVFAGDSIVTGFGIYNTLGKMKISGDKHVVAAVGLNTATFRTRRVFSGKTAVEAITALKPSRLYMMLGINEIHYRSSADVAAGYRETVRIIQKACPDTDIVILAVSPVTKAERQRRSGFAQIPDLNKKLKALAAGLGVRYYDYTGVLKDSSGFLKTQLAAGDGVHWKVAAYDQFAGQIGKYDQSLN